MKFATLAVLVIVGAVFVQNSEAFKCHVCADQDMNGYVEATCPSATDCVAPSGPNCMITRGAGDKFTGACTAEAVAPCSKAKCVCDKDQCNLPGILVDPEVATSPADAAAPRSAQSVNFGVVAALLVVPSVAYLKF